MNGQIIEQFLKSKIYTIYMMQLKAATSKQLTADGSSIVITERVSEKTEKFAMFCFMGPLMPSQKGLTYLM